MIATTQPDRTGYYQTEVGLIPEDWRVKPLGLLTSKMTNGFVGPAIRHYTSEGDGVLYIQGYNVEENSFKFHGIKHVTQAFHKANAKSCLREGDMLTVQTGDVGLTTVIPENLSGSNCHALIISRFNKTSASSRFISYYLNSKPGRARLKLIETGTTMKHLNVGDMLHFLVPLPPTLAEQEAIAEALGDADAWIESLEQLIAKKRHLKQAAMQQLLTGKTRLPGFEGEWRTQTIGDLFRISGGLSASRDQLSHEGHCYLHYGDIHGSSKNFFDVDQEYQDIPKLDVPLNKVSPSALLSDGAVVFVDASEDVDGTNRHVVITNPRNTPFISGLHTIVATPKVDDLEPLYCRFCFETENVKEQFRFFAVGTKVSGISKTNIVKIEVAVPKPEEQSAIASVLTDMDAEISAVKTKLTKARQIKQGMMQELLTGRTRLI